MITNYIFYVMIAGSKSPWIVKPKYSHKLCVKSYMIQMEPWDKLGERLDMKELEWHLALIEWETKEILS